MESGVLITPDSFLWLHKAFLLLFRSYCWGVGFRLR